jgi:hypothetical protein
MTTPDDGPSPEDCLRALGSFVKPLPPGELERRSQLYREAGCLDRDMLILFMLELDAGWA